MAPEILFFVEILHVISKKALNDSVEFYWNFVFGPNPFCVTFGNFQIQSNVQLRTPTSGWTWTSRRRRRLRSREMRRRLVHWDFVEDWTFWDFSWKLCAIVIIWEKNVALNIKIGFFMFSLLWCFRCFTVCMYRLFCFVFFIFICFACVFLSARF